MYIVTLDGVDTWSGVSADTMLAFLQVLPYEFPETRLSWRLDVNYEGVEILEKVEF